MSPWFAFSLCRFMLILQLYSGIESLLSPLSCSQDSLATGPSWGRVDYDQSCLLAIFWHRNSVEFVVIFDEIRQENKLWAEYWLSIMLQSSCLSKDSPCRPFGTAWTTGICNFGQPIGVTKGRGGGSVDEDVKVAMYEQAPSNFIWLGYVGVHVSVSIIKWEYSIQPKTFFLYLTNLSPKFGRDVNRIHDNQKVRSSHWPEDVETNKALGINWATWCCWLFWRHVSWSVTCNQRVDAHPQGKEGDQDLSQTGFWICKRL